MSYRSSFWGGVPAFVTLRDSYGTEKYDDSYSSKKHPGTILSLLETIRVKFTQLKPKMI
jgi:hypothetical protein